MTLKEIYDIKIELAKNNDLASLQTILNSQGVNTYINEDRTIRIESPEGYDKITKSIDYSIPKWYENQIQNPVSLIYNLLPLNKEMCLLHL